MADPGNENQSNGPDGGPPRRVNPTVAVRFGRMRHLGEFSLPRNLEPGCGNKLIIATDRGIEVGDYVPFVCATQGPVASPEQVRAYIKASGPEVFRFRNGRILRQATEEDLVELRHIEQGAREKREACARFAAELGLGMKIVDCEHLFGGERIVFYFMADDRIDFRELVRHLAAEYQTRIEMRQVGARDEARLLADYETCGRRCCCQGFLKTLKPVSMQMAKLQKATLDPAKVSGRCGRLKCCLRYEHENYDTLVKRLPKVGSRIATAEVTGRVIDRQVLTQLVRLVDDEGRVATVSVDEITERNLPRPAPKSEGPVGSRVGNGGSRGNNRRPGNGGPRGNGGRRPARQDKPSASPTGPADETASPAEEPSNDVPQTGVPQGQPDSSKKAISAGQADEASKRRGRRRGRGRGRRSRSSGTPGRNS